MSDNSGFFNKLSKAVNVTLDSYIEKSQTNSNSSSNGAWDRKAMLEIDYGTEQQAGWRERRGLIGPDVMKNMARKDSVIMSIIRTRLSQVSMFTKPQRDRYSPGFVIRRKAPLEMSREDKKKLMDPELSQEERLKIKYEADKRLMEQQKKDEEECSRGLDFILHCGQKPDEVDTTRTRWSFDKFVKLITQDRLIYNYCGIERIFTKDGSKLHHFYPVSSGTIRFVSERSRELFKDQLRKEAIQRGDDPAKYENFGEYKYVQVVRGRIVAAWTEKEFIYEAGMPTVDPEDQGYAPGELELLITLITSHLYAEAHNRNYFTQGIGTKGILHIKGDNISRSQLEAFKRQWLSQVNNTKNAFRPPIIGMADEVRWVQLAQSNKDMEYDNWMHYLIRLICAVYQIDPAEINFDVSKINTSTLNESSNETRIKSSRDKGLRPLLDYIEYIMNTEILPFWDRSWAETYEFSFVGLDAETRQQEADRITKEVQTYKTFNEARIEMGKEPIEGGDIIGNAQYAQALMVSMQNKQAEGQMSEEEAKKQEKEKEKELKERTKELDEYTDEMFKEAQTIGSPKMTANESEETGVSTGKQRANRQSEEKQQGDVEGDETGGVGVGPRGGRYITKPDGTREYRAPKKEDSEETKKSFPVKIEYYQLKEDKVDDEDES